MSREYARAWGKARISGWRSDLAQGIFWPFITVEACLLFSCTPSQKNPAPSGPPMALDDTAKGNDATDTVAIVTSIGTFDTLNHPASIFHSGENFIVRSGIANRTGAPQLFYYTGIDWEAEIRSGGRTVALEGWGLSYPQVVSSDTFPAFASGTISWLAPIGSGGSPNPNLPLSVEVYTAKLVRHARFPHAKVVGTDSVLFFILP